MTDHTDSSKEIEIPKDFALLLLNKAFAYSTNRKPELVSHIRQEDFIEGAEWAYRHLHPSPSGWIEIKPGCEMPATVEGKDYSENVLVILAGKIGVMAYCYIDCDEGSGWAWCNCYGDINGDPEFDSDYKPTHWQPLPAIPGDK
jgi:hypothetical protein